jgi:hypothetical protein
MKQILGRAGRYTNRHRRLCGKRAGLRPTDRDTHDFVRNDSDARAVRLEYERTLRDGKSAATEDG